MDGAICRWRQHFSQEGYLHCWTIMERSTYQALMRDGFLTVPQAFAEPEFTAAYRWLGARMADVGLAAPAAGITPWWCWVQRDTGHPMPYRDDLLGCADPVVLKLRLPVGDVVLSCFELWHCVLNRWYISSSDVDEAEFELLQASADGVITATRREASWAKVFDLEHLFHEKTDINERSIQGTYWLLRAEDVESVLGAETLDVCDVDD